jgi:hypothetical protein
MRYVSLFLGVCQSGIGSYKTSGHLVKRVYVGSRGVSKCLGDRVNRLALGR